MWCKISYFSLLILYRWIIQKEQETESLTVTLNSVSITLVQNYCRIIKKQFAKSNLNTLLNIYFLLINKIAQIKA